MMDPMQQAFSFMKGFHCMLHVSLTILNEKVCFMRTLDGSGLQSACEQLPGTQFWKYFEHDTSISCSAWLRQLLFQFVKETLEQTKLEDVSDHINTLAMELLDVSSLFSNAVEMATNAKGFLEDFNTLSLLFLAAADARSVDNRIDAETGSSIHKAKEIQDAMTALSSRLDFHELNQAFKGGALGQ